jgi:hypothetical protein
MALEQASASASAPASHSRCNRQGR